MLLNGSPADFGVLTNETIKDGAGTPLANWKFLNGPDINGSYQGMGGIGNIIAAVDSVSSRTLVPSIDKQGSVFSWVDAATGEIVATREYDPYGRIVSKTGDDNVPSIGFLGKYYDETGLVYFGRRWYQPSTGTFISRDPRGESMGEYNNYSFCLNDPINRWEYLGCTSYLNPFAGDYFMWEWGGAGAGATNNYVIQPTWTGIKWTGNASWDATVWTGDTIYNKGPVRGFRDWLYEDITGVYIISYHPRGYTRTLIGTPQNSNLSTLLADSRFQGMTDIWLNGQSNDLDASSRLAAFHTRFSTTGSAIVIHNPTSGGVADTVQSIMGKLFWSSKVSRQVAEVLSYRAENNITSRLYFHSQGGVMGTNSLFSLGLPTWLGGYGANWTNAQVEHHGTASNYYVARLATFSAGAEWWGMDNHSKDAVGTLIGLNSVNPIYMVRSGTWFPSLFNNSQRAVNQYGHAPPAISWYTSHHTYYPPMQKEHWSRFFTFPLY